MLVTFYNFYNFLTLHDIFISGIGASVTIYAKSTRKMHWGQKIYLTCWSVFLYLRKILLVDLNPQKLGSLNIVILYEFCSWMEDKR